MPEQDALRRYGQAGRRAPSQPQRGLGAIRDHFSLMLGDGGQDVQLEAGRMRIVHRDELNAGIHQRCTVSRANVTTPAATWGRSFKVPTFR